MIVRFFWNNRTKSKVRNCSKNPIITLTITISFEKNFTIIIKITRNFPVILLLQLQLLSDTFAN